MRQNPARWVSSHSFSACLLLAVVSIGSWLAPSPSLADDQPHVVIVVGTHHYVPHLSMPLFADELRRHGFRTTLVMGDGDPEKKTVNVLPGIEALGQADAAIFFMRFLKLPDDEWAHLANFIESGKPVIGLRTANHSFQYPAEHPRAVWNDGFGRRVLGTPYVVHQSGTTEISVCKNYQSHPILAGVDPTDWTSPGSLYLTRLESGVQPLLIGKGNGRSRLVEKSYGVIQVNESESDIVAWTWTNSWDAKVFSTTMGHPGDFADPRFTRMLVNGVCWACDHPMPEADEPISTWQLQMPRKNKRLSKEPVPSGR